MSSPGFARMGAGTFPVNRLLPMPRPQRNDEQPVPSSFAVNPARLAAQDSIHLSRTTRNVTFQGLGDLTPDTGVDELTETLKNQPRLTMLEKFSQMAVYLRDVRPDLAESEKWAHMDKFLNAFPNLSAKAREGYTTSFRVVSLKKGEQVVEG